MDFAKGEILFHCLRLIGSGAELGGYLSHPSSPGLEQLLQPAISGPQTPGRRRLAEATR